MSPSLKTCIRLNLDLPGLVFSNLESQRSVSSALEDVCPHLGVIKGSSLPSAGLTVPIQQGFNVSLRPMSSAAQEQASRAAPCEASGYSYESLLVTPAQKHILHVQLNRPEKRNAMNKVFWRSGL